jgi:hypothetical protein
MSEADYKLYRGAHDAGGGQRCALEWVAYLAGEEHTDHPVCVSPMLGAFGRSWNDALDNATRQKLRPYLARMIGTAGDGRDEERAWLCTDWLVRVCAPAFMELTPALRESAAVLRGLSPVLSAESVRGVSTEIMRARDESAAAWDAARDAAWDAAGDVARDAARAAAWAAAGAAAGAAAWAAAGAAARDAAWDAAGDVAWDAAGAAAGAAAWAAAWAAARDAAGAAARDALAPTVKELQASAFDLLDRMLPTVPLGLPVVSDAERVLGVSR